MFSNLKFNIQYHDKSIETDLQQLIRENGGIISDNVQDHSVIWIRSSDSGNQNVKVLHHAYIHDCIAVGAILETKEYEFPNHQVYSKELYTKECAVIPNLIHLFEDLELCIANYTGDDLQKINQIIQANYIKVSSHVSETTTHLITSDLSGPRYQESLRISKCHVVNHQWLLECVARNERVAESKPQFVDFLKESKIIKETLTEKDIATDSKRDCDESSKDTNNESLLKRLKISTYIYFLEESSLSEASDALLSLGLQVSQYLEDINYFIASKINTQLAFFTAIQTGKPILTPQWIQDSIKEGSLLDIHNYHLKDPAFESKFNFSLEKTLLSVKENPLIFNNYTIYMYGNGDLEKDVCLRAMVEGAGGTVETFCDDGFICRIRDSKSTPVIICDSPLGWLVKSSRSLGLKVYKRKEILCAYFTRSLARIKPSKY